LNVTCQLLVCANEVNLLEGNIKPTSKNTQTLYNTSKEFDLEVNAEKTKYIFMPHHQSTEQNFNTNS